MQIFFFIEQKALTGTHTHTTSVCVSSTQSAKIGSVLETKAPGMALLSSVYFFPFAFSLFWNWTVL